MSAESLSNEIKFVRTNRTTVSYMGTPLTKSINKTGFRPQIGMDKWRELSRYHNMFFVRKASLPRHHITVNVSLRFHPLLPSHNEDVINKGYQIQIIGRQFLHIESD